MSDYKRVPTSAEVWAVIRARHPEMRVFGSYSAPDGDQFGDPNNCQYCDHSKNPQGGHCYMFREAPTEICRKHTLAGLGASINATEPGK